ncbi:MAG: hypothetical protein FRX49_08411 [Trebouxia sp. A1-2]|nr:MAG: hypothetical protein FRX49_08411 [Trebouxia sp. A1-2]
MYSSSGQTSKTKPTRASSIAKTEDVSTNSDRFSPDSRGVAAVMHLAGLLWMRNKGSKMADLSHGLVEEDLTSNDLARHTQRRRWLSTLGVPRLRSTFLEVFGHHTASNNGAWLRRKLAEPAEGGRGRAVQIRARDASAAIWTTGRVKGVSKAEASAIVAERQAERRASRERSASHDREARSTRSIGGTLSSETFTPSRAAAPKATETAARITRLFAEELPTEKKAYATRATQPVIRDCSLFGVPMAQEGLERLVMQKADLRHRHAMRGLAIDATTVSVLYENGDREDLATSEVLRDGLLSLGWVQPEHPISANSAFCPSPDVASAAGLFITVKQLSTVTVCGAFQVDSEGMLQEDLDTLEPPSKKLKLEISPLDLLSSPPFCPIPLSDCTLSTPSALLPNPSIQANTPADAATCDWADNLLATAHRPTPTARAEDKLTSVTCLKARFEAKSSPVAFRKANPTSLGLVSPPARLVSSVSKGPNPSRLGLNSPLGGFAAANSKGNPFASPPLNGIAHPSAHGSAKQPYSQGTSSHSQSKPQGFSLQSQKPQDMQPPKVRSIPMQPLKAQTSPAPLRLGCQSPSVRAAPRAAVMSGQGIPRQPYAQGQAMQPLSYGLSSSKPGFDMMQSNVKLQCTVTTGLPSSGTVPLHSTSQPLFTQTDARLGEPVPLCNAKTGFLSASGFSTALGPFAAQGSAAKAPQLFGSTAEMSHERAHLSSGMPSFMDSVAAFTEGFTLPHSTDGLDDWGLTTDLRHHKTSDAVETFEIVQYESALSASDLSDDTSEQMWKVSEDVLMDSPGAFQY